MRYYEVIVNGVSRSVKASRASVAVHRALNFYTDGQLDGATVHIRKGKQIRYGYRYIADVPCEPAGSFKREFVSDAILSRDQARLGIRQFESEHPEYRHVQFKKVEY